MNARIQAIEGEFIDGNSMDPDLDAEFQKFREELGEHENEGVVNAYRVPLDERGNPVAKSQKQSFLFAQPMGTVSLMDIIARIKREFMRPGELFTIIRLAGHRPGRRGLEFNKFVRIEKENEAPTVTAAQPQTDVAALMRAMQEMMTMQQQRADALFNKMMELQMNAMRVQQPTAVAAPVNNDPMAFIERMMMMQTAMKRMETLFGASATPAAAAMLNPADQMLQTLRVMKEMRGIMGGDSAGGADTAEDSVMGGLLKLAGPALALMQENERTKQVALTRGAVPARAPRVVAQQPNAARPTPAAQPAATVETDIDANSTTTDAPNNGAEDMSMMQLRDTLKTLCDIAARGGDAVEAATLVLDQTPEEYDDQLGTLVDDANASSFHSKIALLWPECSKHKEWFEELRANLAAAFDDPDTVAN